MPGPRQVFINGKNYDWNNITFVLFGVPLTQITEINYGLTKERKLSYGAGNEPVGYGEGNYNYSGDISVFTDELRRIMATSPNKRITDVPPATASVMYGGDGVPTAVDKLKNIMFTSQPFTGKQGDTTFSTKLPFIYAGQD